MNSKISVILFALVIILFLLPWVSVSCMGAPIVTVTGFDMVTGKEFNMLPSLGAPSDNRLDAEPLAVAALVVAIAGIVSAIVWRKASVARIILGIAGVVLLGALKFKLDSDVSQKGEGVIQMAYQGGYWLTILAFGAAAAVSFIKRDIRFKVTIPAEPVKPDADSPGGNTGDPNSTA